MNQSLSRFFERNTEVSLDTCDREQIHLSGMIQKGMAVCVLDPSDNCILGASENLGDLLGAPLDEMLGKPLSDIAAYIADELVQWDDTGRLTHEILDAQVEHGGTFFDVVTHVHANRRFLEFIPNSSPAPALVRKRVRLCGSACSQIMGAESFEEAAQIAADAVRNLTGLDRVKIYQFLPDWSGAVICESRNNRLESMLGLHFPDTDIPKQVRELMTIVPYRFISETDDQNLPIRVVAGEDRTLDMTWAMSRSSSAMHTAYLRNIGAKSSFSCSLIDKGKLWGLIACHHSEAQTVPADSWSLAQEIAIALMLRHDQAERTETANMIARLRRIENEFAAELRRSGDVEDVIKTLVPILQQFLRADGFAFQYGQNLHTSGATPPPAFVRDLIRWAKDSFGESDQLQSPALHTIYPEAAEHIDVACGVLVQPIVMHRVCQLLWFRGPITRRVAWAGRPDTKVQVDPKTGATLGPRTSFDRWIEEHCDQSLPWAEAELEAAREIFKEFLDIIASQLLLKEENSSLRQFAHIAAHDIRSPLRGISAALQWMEEDSSDPEMLREHRALAARQAAKLQRLTESLLEMSLLEDQRPRFENVDLSEIAGEACEMMGHQIEVARAEVNVGPLPTCRASADLMLRIFMNLIGNAIKYASAEGGLVVDIGHTETAGKYLLHVADNGTGIPENYVKQIFEPSQRLVSNDDVEGSGFGLAICAEIAKKHGGRIFVDTAYSDGASFVIELPKHIS